MRKGPKVLLGCLGVVVLACLIAAVSVEIVIQRMAKDSDGNPALLNEAIQALPVGTPEERVRAFLNQHGIENGNEPNASAIWAVFRHTGGGFPVVEDARVVFHLGVDRKVVRVERERWLTGP